MEQETLYGNDDFFNRNDGDASGKPFPPAFGPQEELQIGEVKELSEFKTSNRRLDNYHLTFSSWL